ncbi:pilus assembly protein [bacterium]|nr:pilus assembly protein [bacterium]
MGRRRNQLAVIRQVSGESGQAMVEAAIAIPVLLLLVFGVIAIGRVTDARIGVQAAAREASRTLAVAPSEEQGVSDALEAGHAAASGYGLSNDRLTIEVDANGFARGGDVTADVSYSVPLSDLPLLSFFDVDVSSSHTEQVELYRSRGAVTR